MCLVVTGWGPEKSLPAAFTQTLHPSYTLYGIYSYLLKVVEFCFATLIYGRFVQTLKAMHPWSQKVRLRQQHHRPLSTMNCPANSWSTKI